MQHADIRKQWEDAAPGWARWEASISAWMEPATAAMLAMAGIDTGKRVLDLASGAGSQTLAAARLVGPQGHVVANDISDTMLHHVRENAVPQRWPMSAPWRAPPKTWTLPPKASMPSSVGSA